MAMMQQELAILREAVLRSPIRALQDLREWTYNYFACRRLPRKERWHKSGKLANFATRVPEREFCRRLVMILDRTEEKLQVVENSTKEWVENRRTALGPVRGAPSPRTIAHWEESWNVQEKVWLNLQHFRRWMKRLRHFGTPGQAANEFHEGECKDKRCLGYCDLHNVNRNEAIRVSPPISRSAGGRMGVRTSSPMSTHGPLLPTRSAAPSTTTTANSRLVPSL